MNGVPAIVAEASTPAMFARAHIMARTARLGGRTLVPSPNPDVTRRLTSACANLETEYAVLGPEATANAWAECGPDAEVERICQAEADRPARLFQHLFEAIGSGLVRLGDRQGRQSALHGQAAILCLSSEGLAAACQYGLLTGRPVLFDANSADDESLLQAVETCASVLVVPPHDWNVARLHRFLNAKHAVCPGLSVGMSYPYGAGVSAFFPLKAFLYDSLAIPEGWRSTFLFPLEPRSASFSVGAADFLVGTQPVGQTSAVLTRPSTYLFATSHANGVDASLGSVVLCSKLDRDPDAAGISRAMPCFYEDVCSRKTPHNLLLPPSEVRSLVTFLYTCWGVLLEGGTYDPVISLGHRFAGSTYTAALLTTYSMSLLDRSIGLTVADMLSDGHSVGSTAAEVNTRHYEQYHDHPSVVVLFGDPELRLRFTEPLRLHSTAPQHPEARRFFSAVGVRLSQPPNPCDSVTAIEPRVFAAVEYARCVVNATGRLGLEPLGPALSEMGRHTEQLWMSAMLVNGRVAQAGIIDTTVRSLLSSHTSAVARFQTSWANFYTAMVCCLGGYVRLQVDRYFTGRTEHALESRPCPYCNAPLFESESHLAGSDACRRRVVECLNCATIADGAPELTDGSLVCDSQWARGTDVALGLRVRSLVKAGRYAARVILEPFNKPVAPDGSFVTSEGDIVCDANGYVDLRLPSMRIDRQRVPGCYHLNAIVILDTSVMVLRRAIYIVP